MADHQMSKPQPIMSAMNLPSSYYDLAIVETKLLSYDANTHHYTGIIDITETYMLAFIAKSSGLVLSLMFKSSSTGREIQFDPKWANKVAHSQLLSVRYVAEVDGQVITADIGWKLL